jgi:hypothetical protein
MNPSALVATTQGVEAVLFLGLACGFVIGLVWGLCLKPRPQLNFQPGDISGTGYRGAHVKGVIIDEWEPAAGIYGAGTTWPHIDPETSMTRHQFADPDL